MMQMLEIALLIPSVIVLMLALFLCAEVFGAFTPAKVREDEPEDIGDIAVIIPAHNEAASVGETLFSVMAQARERDRVIVVADNCTDQTANIALSAGAQCWERDNDALRGKGYALQFALDRLAAEAPRTVIFIDADCKIAEGALMKLAGASEKSQRPVQALYLMQAQQGASPRTQIAEFAWAFLNHVRMRGLYRIAGVSRLTGAGMALPWEIAKTLSVGTGEIVEDLSLTLDLTERKSPPLLCLDAVVTSGFPGADDAVAKQRARWEHGSQRLAVRRAAPSLIKGLAAGNWPLCAISIDLLIPPIMNFIALIGLLVAAGVIAWVLGAQTPLILSIAAAVTVAASIGAAWLKFGRAILPLESLTGVLPFLAAKRRIYGAEGRASAKEWTPTRSGDNDRQGER